MIKTTTQLVFIAMAVVSGTTFSCKEAELAPKTEQEEVFERTAELKYYNKTNASATSFITLDPENPSYILNWAQAKAKSEEVGIGFYFSLVDTFYITGIKDAGVDVIYNNPVYGTAGWKNQVRSSFGFIEKGDLPSADYKDIKNNIPDTDSAFVNKIVNEGDVFWFVTDQYKGYCRINEKFKDIDSYRVKLTFRYIKR